MFRAAVAGLPVQPQAPCEFPCAFPGWDPSASAPQLRVEGDDAVGGASVVGIHDELVL